MSEKITSRILRQTQTPDLLDILARRLAPTDLQSLLLETYRQRASQETPARVLERYAQNPFTRPALPDPVALRHLELLAFSLASPTFEPIELSPLAPLGSCSALAPVDQNKTVTTIRNTEVVSDSTNVLALECALRRKTQRTQPQPQAQPQLPAAQTTVRLCAAHRLVRAQQFNQPHMRAHFSMFTTCTAGRISQPHQFETAALFEQITFYLSFMQAAQAQGYLISNPRIAITPLSETPDLQAHLEQHLLAPLSTQFPQANLHIDATHKVRDYYTYARYRIFATAPDNTEQMIGDGGFANWTQKLLSDNHERLLTGGIATERLLTVFQP